MEKNILISFSGGRTSAFMCKLILSSPKYDDYNKLILFANTGKESEETLKFIDRCDKEWKLGIVWLEAEVVPGKGNGTQYKVVTFETASRNGEPFEDVIKKYGLPSKLYRHCTRELKESPIHKYAKEKFGKRGAYVTAIGIRADEKHRLGSKPKIIYPLAEVGVTEEIVRNWWDRQSFDLNLKDYEGNCDLCFLKSVRKKLTLLKEKPLLAEWWNDMEENYASDKQPILDVYRDLSIQKLVDKAQEEFNPAVDQHELRKGQPSLFDIDMDMDLEFDCFCKAN